MDRIPKDQTGASIDVFWKADKEGSTVTTEASSAPLSRPSHSSRMGGEFPSFSSIVIDASKLADINSSKHSDLDSSLDGPKSRSVEWNESMDQSFCQFDDVWWEEDTTHKTVGRNVMSTAGECSFRDIVPKAKSQIDEPFGKVTLPPSGSDIGRQAGASGSSAWGKEPQKAVALKVSSRDTPHHNDRKGGAARSTSDRFLRKSSSKDMLRSSVRRTGSLEYMKPGSKETNHPSMLRNATFSTETTSSLRRTRSVVESNHHLTTLRNAAFPTTNRRASTTTNKQHKSSDRKRSITRQSSKVILIPSPPRPPLQRAASFDSLLSQDKAHPLPSELAAIYAASSLLGCPPSEKVTSKRESLQGFMASGKGSAKKERPLLQRSTSYESIVDKALVQPVKKSLERESSTRAAGSRRSSPSIEKRFSRRQSSTKLAGLDGDLNLRDLDRVNSASRPRSVSQSEAKAENKEIKRNKLPPSLEAKEAPKRSEAPRSQSHHISTSKKIQRRDPRRVQSSREIKRERSTRGGLSEAPVAKKEEPEIDFSDSMTWHRNSSKSDAAGHHPLTKRIQKDQEQSHANIASSAEQPRVRVKTSPKNPVNRPKFSQAA
jgi:hypothetical protein